MSYLPSHLKLCLVYKCIQYFIEFYINKQIQFSSDPSFQNLPGFENFCNYPNVQNIDNFLGNIQDTVEMPAYMNNHFFMYFRITYDQALSTIPITLFR